MALISSTHPPQPSWKTPSFEGATVDDWEAYYVRPPEIVHTVSYKGE
jgi:hypothetical protein